MPKIAFEKTMRSRLHRPARLEGMLENAFTEYRYHSSETGPQYEEQASLFGGVIQQSFTSVATANARNSKQSAERDRWLLVIGFFKFAKGIFFVLIGVGVLRLVHRDLADILLRFAQSFRIDPESHLVNLLLDKAQALTPHRLKWIGTAVFLDAGLDFIEGTGLILRKRWAEYFTLILTASFLPWELFEIIRHVTPIKIGLTIVNVLVVLYLAYVLKQREAVSDPQDE